MTTLSKEQLTDLRDFCDEYDYDLREQYSGRGMYRKNCIGFVTDDSPFTIAMNLTAFLRAENEQGSDCELIDIFTNTGVRTDSMGKSSIIYFPAISKEE